MMEYTYQIELYFFYIICNTKEIKYNFLTSLICLCKSLCQDPFTKLYSLNKAFMLFKPKMFFESINFDIYKSYIGKNRLLFLFIVYFKKDSFIFLIKFYPMKIYIPWVFPNSSSSFNGIYKLFRGSWWCGYKKSFFSIINSTPL